jgi:hypothetical protein
MLKHSSCNLVLFHVNQKLLSQLQPKQIEVVVERMGASQELGVEESELDEMSLADIK